MVSDFNKINFGMAAAEAERANQPKLLEEGFFDAYGFIDKIVNKHYFVIYGQKGSGKSAIASKLDLNPPENTEVTVCTLDQLNFNGFEGVLHTREAPENKDVDTWTFLIAIQLINTFRKDASCWKSRSGKVIPKNIIKGLEEVGLAPSKNFSYAVDRISKKDFNINLGIFRGTSSHEKITKNDVDKMRLNLVNAVYDADLSKHFLLIIDGVDDVLIKRKNQMRILSGLLYACSKMNEEFKKNGIEIKIVVLYRTDILDNLENPNKTKIINDYGIILDWYENVRNIKETSIYRLINLRARISLNREVDVFTEFFPEEIIGRSSANYIFDNTRHTPRDVVMIMNNIQKSSRSRVTKDSIANGIRIYSNDYFLSEIKDSLTGFVEKNGIENVFKLIMMVGKLKTTIDELRETANKANLDVDFDKILPILFEVGAIGNIRYGDAGDEFYMFKYRNRHLVFNIFEDIAVHIGLKGALSLGKK